jgi:integrase/recombinase XerD
MFERLLKRPCVRARHCQGPLAEERRRFLAHCAELGMSDRTLRDLGSYLLSIAAYLRLDDRPDDLIPAAEIETQADRWANRPRISGRSKRTRGGRANFLSYATRWLQFLGRWRAPVAVARPYADRVAAFADHMRRERGLSPGTVRWRCRVAQEIIDRLCASRRLQEVTPAQVDDALLQKLKQGGCARITVRAYSTALRAFFRYAETQGWCHHSLAEAIHAPRVFSQDTLPCGPSWDDVQRLLASVGEDSPKAIRDRAILLLLAVYGCRAGEVVRLRLDDLDWERELIHFTRLKPCRRQTYPLSRPVGDAVLRYLQNGRPLSPWREVFLRLNAPIRPLASQSLWIIVAQRLRALGVSLRHYGPHSLRHASATHLLEQGFTLKQIGDHLGHRHPDSTRIYAKVDLAGLCQVADFDIGDLL